MTRERSNRLGGADELLVHQLARPFAEVVEDAPTWFDRFYFNAHPPGPGPVLVLGGARYNNVGVLDGYACLVHEGFQRNVRFSTLDDGAVPSMVGPLSWEVVVPHKQWRLHLDATPQGFEFDGVWSARSTPNLVEPISVAHDDGPSTDFSHYFQAGRWSGSMTIDGETRSLDGWMGMRDRSWGVRRTRERLGLHLWGGAQLDDRCVAVLYNEDRHGNPAHVEGVVLSDDGRPPVAVATVNHDLNLDDGNELIDGRVRLTLETGERVDVDWEGLGRGLYLAGAGYDGWHGQDRGLDHIESERWQLSSERNPRTLPIGVVNKLSRCRVAGEVGHGVFELAVSRSPSYTYRPNIGES